MKVVVDWDGTATEIDGLYEVVRTFGDERIYDKTEGKLGRALTLNEVIAIEVGTITVSLTEVVAWVRENVRVRAGFGEFAHTHRPLVVSSGFHELIEPVLEREGIELDVVANRVEARPEGWLARFRRAEPCAVCDEPCKRSDLRELDEFVYVGDGFSDRCVALAATRLFARDGLAEYLEKEGAAFERFEDFNYIASML